MTDPIDSAFCFLLDLCKEIFILLKCAQVTFVCKVKVSVSSNIEVSILLCRIWVSSDQFINTIWIRGSNKHSSVIVDFKQYYPSFAFESQSNELNSRLYLNTRMIILRIKCWSLNKTYLFLFSELLELSEQKRVSPMFSHLPIYNMVFG